MGTNIEESTMIGSGADGEPVRIDKSSCTRGIHVPSGWHDYILHVYCLCFDGPDVGKCAEWAVEFSTEDVDGVLEFAAKPKNKGRDGGWSTKDWAPRFADGLLAAARIQVALDGSDSSLQLTCYGVAGRGGANQYHWSAMILDKRERGSC